MKYEKYAPQDSLKKLVDFYWILQTGAVYKPKKIPLYADACTDLFVNCGSGSVNFNDRTSLRPGRIYIGGTSTASSFVEACPDCIFAGVRFKPGGLQYFYGIQLFEIVDHIIEFQDNHFFSLIDTDKLLANRLNQFYAARQNKTSHIEPIIDAVYHVNGRLSVDELRLKCNVTNRTLERLFHVNVGVPPKEFINIVRFQETVKALQKRTAARQITTCCLRNGLLRSCPPHQGCEKTCLRKAIRNLARAIFSVIGAKGR